MNIKNRDFLTIDKYCLFLYVGLITIGCINIFSVGFSFSEFKEIASIFEFKDFFSKQIIWIFVSFFLIIVIFLLDYRTFLHSHVYIYTISILLLLGLFLFGSNIKGQVSWYKIGNLGIQPSEFSKFATSVLFSFYISRRGVDLLKIKNIAGISTIIILPVFLILLEPDVGSALTFSAFLLVLFMMGYHIYFVLLIYVGLLFILGIIFDKFLVFSGLIVSAVIIFIFLVINNKTIRNFRYFLFMILVGSFIFLNGLNFFWNTILKDRHRDRINVTLGLLEDNRGVGYNTYQSKIAIGSGGIVGRGFRQGLYNRGSFVPEQHSDFIFCTIGEEWGFLGSSIFIIFYLLFIARLYKISNRQKSDFVRVYGYCLTSFIFIHFFINISMVLGIIPVIGIPLIFISYGGSSIIIFTIMLFILLRLDIQRDYIM